MKKDQVPQDDCHLEGHQKAVYAIDEAGRYGVVAYRGWAAEELATSIAHEAQDRVLLAAWEQARAGTRSPLAYYMTLRQLTAGVLAQYVGIASWRVRWHLRRWGFRHMSIEMALRYCKVLDIPIERLLAVPPEPALAGGSSA
jgi:hypothetical protein